MVYLPLAKYCPSSVHKTGLPAEIFLWGELPVIYED